MTIEKDENVYPGSTNPWEVDYREVDYPAAQYRLASHLIRTQGLSDHLASTLLRAAEIGIPEGQNDYTSLILEGILPPEAAQRADVNTWILEAAKQGDAKAVQFVQSQTLSEKSPPVLWKHIG